VPFVTLCGLNFVPLCAFVIILCGILKFNLMDSFSLQL
jgi:hypothetical protein